MEDAFRSEVGGQDVLWVPDRFASRFEPAVREAANPMTTDRPIYFNSLELENVRCFGRSQRLDLTDENGSPFQWILVLGDNGVGKTTLLQCLAWMRPVPWIHEETGQIAGTEPALNSEENEVWDSLIRMGDEVDVTLKATLSVGRNLGRESVEEVESLKTFVEMRGKDGLLQQRNQPLSVGNPYPPFLHTDLAIFAYGAMRRPGTLTRDREELSDPLGSLFRESAELYDAEDILLKLDHRAKDGTGQDQALLRDVKRLLAAVLPDVADERKIHIRPPRVFGSRRENSGVRFETPYGTVPLSGLSLGYQTTLTWDYGSCPAPVRQVPGEFQPLGRARHRAHRQYRPASSPALAASDDEGYHGTLPSRAIHRDGAQPSGRAGGRGTQSLWYCGSAMAKSSLTTNTNS